MTKPNHYDYLAPEMEMVDVEIEAGFALSNLENIGGENPEQDW